MNKRGVNEQMSLYGPILIVCKWLDKVLNFLLLGLFLVEAYFAVKSGYNLSKLKKRINELNNPKVKKGKSIRKNKGEIETHYDDPVKKWSDLEEFMKDYQEKMKTYTAFTLIIQLFTLLGILGTVAGLFVAMQDMETAENLFEGVKFALSSTVLGIISAIIYKIVDIVLSANYVSHIDDGIEMFEKDYNINSSDAFHDILEKMTDSSRSTKEVE